VDDQLKNIKSSVQEKIFKDYHFDSKNRQAVFHKLRNKNYLKSENKKHLITNRFRGLLTILAYSGMLFLITSIVLNYLDNSTKTMPNSNPNDGEEVVTHDPVGKSDVGKIVTKNEYKNDKYSFKLILPDEWINVVWVEETKSGVRFFYVGKDEYNQDLLRIEIEKIEDRLKFLYEGGPDPSTEFAVLGDNIYRYSTPLDLALSLEEDIQKYGKLNSQISSVIQSFTFSNNNSGLIGETPFIYGYTPQYNQLHGFEVNTPNKWKNLFRIIETETEMKFVFQKAESEKTEFFSIMFLSQEEWSNLQSTSNEEREFTLITTKDNIAFVAMTVKQNPFQESELFFPYEMLRTEAKFVIESFQFLN
jgi:hypothetical protein